MSKPPTTELGSITDAGIAPWTAFTGDATEHVGELQWPLSVLTYNAMLNDAQIEGLFYGATLPIRRYTWMIDANGARPEVVDAIAKDLNLPVMDPATGLPTKAPKGRAKKRFSHDRHLFHALRALIFGFYYMETVGVIDDAGMFRLRKLAPRPPGTIDQIHVAEDGGLVYIRQNIGKNGLMAAAEIPVDRLVAYVWDQEGGNWVGRSMLRSIYRNWLIKDRLLRVDAIKHERNGVGMPVAYGAPGMTGPDLAKLGAMAQTYKAGESGGGAMPYGTDLKLKGTEGSLPDTIGSIRFHNEEMARRFLMMFMQLGQTQSGSRALGSEFLDYFGLAQESIANWYQDITNEHVIEDLVDYNWPDEELVPLLCYHKNDQNPASALDAALQSGTVTADPQIQQAVAAAAAHIPSAPYQRTPPDAERKPRERAIEASSAAIPLPDRPLRRDPLPIELASGVDFAKMDSLWQSNLDSLFASWKADVTSPQIADIYDQISRTSSITKLAAVEPQARGQELLVEAMVKMFHDGVEMAVEEAASQGKTIVPPLVDDYIDSIRSRASAIEGILARALGGMGGSKAVALSGGSKKRAEVAEHTAAYLSGLSHQMVKDRLQGSLTAAMNDGRKAVFKEGNPERLMASELLDPNTCVPCSQVDGTEYASLSDAEADYPSGGFAECSGGDRCRGTLVSIYAEDNA